jgi:hypothetical protein
MNKRILDGVGVWKSDKIARIQPEWIRAEYANWIPLALANGSFEADTRKIWSTVYSYNRPDISFDIVEEIKREFCRVGLLFLWQDEGSGKIWGYFTGIEKPGRLPAKSRLDRKHEPIGPIPPADALRSYRELTRSKALDADMVSQWLANGCLGFGFGSGLGIGLGVGKTSSQKTASTSTTSEAVTGFRRHKVAPGDSRFQPFFAFAFESFAVKHGRKPLWQGKDRNGLKNLLKNHGAEILSLERLQTNWRNFLDSTEPFTVKQGDSLGYFSSNVDKFSDGPILAAPRKGTNENRKPTVGDNMRQTLEAFRTSEQKPIN